jgi:hypothetical protein
MVEELEQLIQSMSVSNKMKDDAIAHLSDQLIDQFRYNRKTTAIEDPSVLNCFQ